MSSTADFNNDAWLATEVAYDPAKGEVVVRLRAKQAIRVIEVQGFASDVEAFGLSMPSGFRPMRFGEGVDIPVEMQTEIELMNRLNFRWGCELPVKAGSTLELRLPASGPGKDRLVLTLTYEYPKLFGLLKGKNGFYARMSPDQRDQVCRASAWPRAARPVFLGWFDRGPTGWA